MAPPGSQSSRAFGIEHQPLTEDQIAAALLDPAVFCHDHCWIRAKSGKPEPFHLWDFQRETMACFDDEPRTLVLKARQLGISWLADAYALWLCTANQGQTVLIMSQGQRESKEEMRRIRFMHERLPPELRRKTGAAAQDSHTPDTTEHLEFPEMDSRILSLPSTEHAGTSFTATLVIIHELAKIPTASTLIPAITPTMADTGRLIIVSTAFGYGGTFYEYWHQNEGRWHTGQIVGDKGEEGTFRPVFIPWHARPGRDQKWYAATQRAMTKESTMRQEYPACLTAEALVSTHRGIVPISEARQGDHSESGLVLAAGPQPVSPIYKLTTAQGRILRGTGDHPIHTPGGEFVGLADLSEGQEISLRAPRFAESPAVVRMPALPGAEHTITVDECWGRLLGYFAGDGSVHGAGQISVVCDAKDPDVVADVGQLLTELIGAPNSREHQHGPTGSSSRPDSGAVELRVQRKEALAALVAMGAAGYNPAQGSSRRHVCVPDVIWRSPRPVVRQFLRGLYEADGSATLSGMVRFGASKRLLVQQVQLLLLGFGINAAIAERHNRRSIGSRPEALYSFWALDLPTEASLLFHKHIGFISARKSGRQPRPKVKRLLKPHRLVDSVGSVQPDGHEVTYDLTVQSEHVFCANGILTHNTPTEAWGGTVDAVFADEFQRHTHGIDASRHPGSNYEVAHGMDLGVNHAYSYLIEVQGATAFVFSEIHLENDTVEALGYATAGEDREFGLDPMEVTSYVDPAGVARNMQTLRTDYDVLKECGLLIDEQSGKVSPAQRVGIIKKLLKSGRLWISLDCPELLDALERAQWRTRRGPGGVKIREDTYQKDGKWEHPLDALGYALCRIFPPTSPAAVSTLDPTQGSVPAAVGAGFGSYSGSEFGG